MLKEPGIAINRISEAIHDVGHGIELDDPPVLVGHDLDVPEDWRSPLKELQEDGYDLQKVSEEHHYCTGCVADGEHQNKLAANIVDQLEPVNIRIIAVYAGDDHHYSNEKEMYEHCSDDLDNGQNADLEEHFFNKIIVL